MRPRKLQPVPLHRVHRVEDRHLPHLVVAAHVLVQDDLLLGRNADLLHRPVVVEAEPVDLLVVQRWRLGVRVESTHVMHSDGAVAQDQHLAQVLRDFDLLDGLFCLDRKLVLAPGLHLAVIPSRPLADMVHEHLAIGSAQVDARLCTKQPDRAKGHASRKYPTACNAVLTAMQPRCQPWGGSHTEEVEALDFGVMCYLLDDGLELEGDPPVFRGHGGSSQAGWLLPGLTPGAIVRIF